MAGRAPPNPRSARALRTTFFALAAALAIYGVLYGWWLDTTGGLALTAKSLWLAVLGIISFFIAAWRFPMRAQLRIFVVLVWLLVVEVLLQITSWVGLLPAVNTKAKVPYGRVYWTSEGHGNSIRNRFGWHFPEFDLHAKHRVVVIGDSFVEAVEVNRSHNLAAQLQAALKERASDWSVLGLGNHGTCPAHHLDVIEYAQRHFAPQEAIVVIYTGNDVTESSPALNYLPPQNYTYYDLDRDGRLVLNSASAPWRETFIKGMEACHRTLWMHLPAIANSHCMLLQIPLSVRATIEIARRQREYIARNPSAPEFAKVGLNPAVAALQPSPEVDHAFAIMFAELERLKEMCDNYGVTLRLVTIPCFPGKFYETQHGREWATRVGDFDFFGPERRLAHFASERGISHLELGALMQAKKLEVEEIRALYLSNGIGHFSEAGHRFCADAIFAAFYAGILSAHPQ
jgi:hypothetical protein